jgi:hypothetical protein
MGEDMRSLVSILTLFVTVTIISGCISQGGPPVATNFIFTPQSTTAATKNNMSIAIISPRRVGSFFELDQSDNGGVIGQFMDSTQVRLNITLANSFGLQSTAQASGTISIEFLEPMSREKVWIKRFELPPVTQPVELALIRGPNGMLAHNLDGSLVVGLSRNSTVKLLNEFYGSAFTKIWDQLDPKEIRGLKADADKLKSRTNYRG